MADITKNIVYHPQHQYYTSEIYSTRTANTKLQVSQVLQVVGPGKYVTANFTLFSLQKNTFVTGKVEELPQFANFIKWNGPEQTLGNPSVTVENIETAAKDPTN